MGPLGQLTDKQRAALLGRINPDRVKELKGMAHLEAWDIRRVLNKIFGICGWDFEVAETELVYHHSEEKKRRNGDGTYLAHTVVYRVTGRLILKDQYGYPIAHFDDGAAGDATNQPSVGDAHDMALKTAMSQALKRTAVNLGDQFGLSLYNDGSLHPTVVATLVPDAGDYTREPVEESA
ncbi:Rad52/Rad22 family DNA repair protein [Glycomyces paridis]|uniref:DNA repair protein Rad52 n=1 Tax=Glycomyces paridis TaxID=2126555 RepID=A0A4V4HNG4_9ACTN|nr:Rad52/Rad22 family DNA repair protein [Glycomyces paridis]THV25976.1 hypothetical protein E9998_19780 [Glycomyces paridis]